VVDDWRTHRFSEATARAVAALVEGAGLGRCAVRPGDGAFWLVLVDLGRQDAAGDLVLLATLGDAGPLISEGMRVFGQGRGWRAARATLPTAEGEAQVRELLADAVAAEVEERGRAGKA
jgi:hypothetical protein